MINYNLWPGRIDGKAPLPSCNIKTHSNFLDNLYSNPDKYKKFRSVVDDMLSELKTERLKYSDYNLPLGFDRTMLLSEVEEKSIADAILIMARSINEHKYTMPDGIELNRIEVADYNQKDVPIPYIRLHVRCLMDIAPVNGFYLRGIFNKEKILREIVKAKITKIVYFTESKEEKILMSF